MEVSDVLRDRMQQPGGLTSMATVSVGMHAMALAALMFVSTNGSFRLAETPREIMTITLGGGGGPATGGMTPLAARPIQAPLEETRRPEAVRPPAVAPPEMALPNTRTARPTPPTRGAEPRPGNAVAETGARGRGTGLSTGGAPGTDATLDVADFCCPDYLVLMTERIKGAWNQNQGVGGLVIIRFVIQRDGRLTDAMIERQSGQQALDLAALRAVVVAKQLPPLPAAFPNPSLTVHLNFQYQR